MRGVGIRPRAWRLPCAMGRGAWHAFLALCLMVVAACAGAQAAPFARTTLPGADGAALQAIARPALAPPERYQVVVVPGSGCAGMGSLAHRYFAGLLHARVLVLHKRGVSADAETEPAQCAASFVRTDAHSRWLADAQAALSAWRAQDATPLPLVLVGISEGAELLPALARQLQPEALILLGSSGLDPAQAGALQAERLGAEDAWQALGEAVLGSQPDDTVLQGRSLRYWRDLWFWPLEQALLDGPWPLLQIWGGADALVPQSAYERFEGSARGRAAPYCAVRLEGADHDLQSPARDGVQWLWARLESWARAPGPGWCAAFRLSP